MADSHRAVCFGARRGGRGERYAPSTGGVRAPVAARRDSERNPVFCACTVCQLKKMHTWHVDVVSKRQGTEPPGRGGWRSLFLLPPPRYLTVISWLSHGHLAVISWLSHGYLTIISRLTAI